MQIGSVSSRPAEKPNVSQLGNGAARTGKCLLQLVRVSHADKTAIISFEPSYLCLPLPFVSALKPLQRMVRLAALLLLFGCLVVEGNRCHYRELYRPQPVEVPRLRPRICRGAGSFIGDDYWTSIGYDGQIRDGRSRGDFLVFDQISNGYIAYWITRTKYGNVHYEAFGHAFVRPDGKICAWFVGKEKEIVEVCGGFRVLSRSRFNPSESLPFEWIPATPETHNRDTLGFHNHRIGKYSWEGEDFYGDARLHDKNFQGVSPTSEAFVEVTEPFDFERKVWILRRKADASRTPPAPRRVEQSPPATEWRYADPHTKEDQRYPTPQEPVRPYAPSDSKDPRHNDPRYWFDRRNWKWIDGKWSYDPGNYEYYQLDPEGQHARSQQRRGERPQFYQLDPRDPRFKNETVDTWNDQNVPSQDRLSVPGYPYSDGRPQAAARVVGDNDGWHVVGDNSGTPGIGEGAAPSGSIGQGVRPEGQRPLEDGQAPPAAPKAADVQAGQYTDHYGREVSVNRGGRPVGEGVGPGSSSNIGQGVHPQGEKPASKSQAGDSPSGVSDIQPGYYTDSYGRQVPTGGVKQIGEGVVPQSEVPLNPQEVVSFPNAAPQTVGQEDQPGQHFTKVHRPTVIKDEFGTVYHTTVINGQVHYIPDPEQSQIVRPDPRLVSNPRATELDNAQWRRQKEHMRIAEEERKLQEQAVRDRWANKQNSGQAKKEENSQWKQVGRTDEVRSEDVGQHQQEDPIPFEKDEDVDEEPAAEQPAKLPTPRETPEEVTEDDEDDA